MSTHIVDMIVAVELPIATSIGEPTHLVVQLGGDNNLRDSVTGHRSKSWYPTAIGAEWEVIGRAADLSSDCSGGMMRFVGQARTTPEAFIRGYRSALRNALTLQEARLELGLYFDGTLRRKKPVTEDDHRNLKYWLENLAKHNKVPEEETRYGETYLIATFDLYDPASLSDWQNCRNNNCYESFRVSGHETGTRADLIRRVKRIVANRNRAKLVQPAAVAP
jgi:hypothetical protein